MGLDLRAARDNLHTHNGSGSSAGRKLQCQVSFSVPELRLLLPVPFYATASGT